MSSSKLVSIITPCYNGAEFVHRLLDSLLSQTYTDLEIIFVNDGSTDSTEEVVRGYMPRFEELGMSFIYIYQENAGQASALNKGLKIFSGEYLMWPDSDDYLSNNAISTMVSFLEENDTYSTVRCNGFLIEEFTNKIIGEFAKRNKNYDKTYLFDDCFLERDFWYCPVTFMARSSSFISVNPSKDIYISRGGQNWQMMLPLLFQQKCGYISTPICCYFVRNASHSRELTSCDEQITRREMHKLILTETLNRMELSQEMLEYYLNLLEQKYYNIRFKLFLTHNQFNLAKREYENIKQINRTLILKLMYMTRGNKFLLTVFYFISRLKKYFLK